jgi:hypothetical protein
MAKKKMKQKKHAFRNASAPRPPRARATPADDTPVRRLAYTIGGAGGAALAVSLMKHEGWKPKTIATALGAAGAALALKAEEPSMQSIGTGALAAAGATLALLTMEDYDAKASGDGKVASNEAKPTDASASLPRQADALPPGALENALARAQARLAISDAELAI